MFSLSYFLLERVKKAFFRVLKAAQANDVVEFTCARVFTLVRDTRDDPGSLNAM